MSESAALDATNNDVPTEINSKEKFTFYIRVCIIYYTE